MKKAELIAALAELSDDCDIWIEAVGSGFMWDYRVSVFDEDGLDEPVFACLTLVHDNYEDDDIHIVIKPLTG